MEQHDRTHVDRVIADHAQELLRVPGVVGVGAGVVDDQPVVEVLVEVDPDAVRDRLPTELDGISVHVTRTGTIRARPGD